MATPRATPMDAAAKMMLERIMLIQPEYVLYKPINKKQSVAFKVENSGDRVVVLKMKSTVAALFRMKPVHFVLHPKEKRTIQLTFKGFPPGKSPSYQERFTLIMVYPPGTVADPKAFWSDKKTVEKLTPSTARKSIPVVFEGHEHKVKGFKLEKKSQSNSKAPTAAPQAKEDQEPDVEKSSRRRSKPAKSPAPAQESDAEKSSRRKKKTSKPAGAKSGDITPPLGSLPPEPEGDVAVIPSIPASNPAKAPEVPAAAPAAPAAAPASSQKPSDQQQPGMQLNGANLVYIIYQNEGKDAKEEDEQDGEEDSDDEDEGKKKKKK